MNILSNTVQYSTVHSVVLVVLLAVVDFLDSVPGVEVLSIVCSRSFATCSCAQRLPLIRVRRDADLPKLATGRLAYIPSGIFARAPQ